MNIRDLPSGSYKVVQPNTVNIKDLAPGSYQVVSPQTSNEQKGDGFFKSLAKSVASPFLRLGATAQAFGTSKIFGGKGADTSDKNLPFFGPQKPITTAKDALGVGAELASYAVGGEGTAQVAKQGLKGLVKQGIVSGAKAGAASGALYSGGKAAQDNKSAGQIFSDTLKGGAAGAAVGGVLGGAVPLATQGARRVLDKAQTRVFEAVTPKVNELTPTEYERFLSRGKIAPKTTTQPARYILSDAEKEAAVKYRHLIEGKDPVKNTLNVVEEIARQDQHVGNFLQNNNAIFNGGELRNYILTQLADVTDVTVDEARLAHAKTELATNFVNSLEKNDMHSLWQARKAFDRQIDKSFTGAPTLQNQVKREFRNAIQDFISTKTDNVTYKGYMKDMSELFNMKDILTTKAAKEKSYNAIQLWIKHNPAKAKIIGWSVGTGILGAIGKSLF